MKPLYLLPMLLATALVISSCERDMEPVDPAHEGTILTAHTRTNFADLFTSRLYVRNGAGQLIMYRDSSGFAYNARTFEYDVDGKVSKVNLYNDQGALTDHFELEYNSNGKVVKRVHVNYIVAGPPRYNTYTYDSAGKLLIDSLFVSLGTGYFAASVVEFHYTGDNVTEAKYHTSHTSTGMTPQFKIKYEYDNGLNPLKNISNYYCLTAISAGIYYARFESKNNVTREYHAIPNDPYELRKKYSYRYNSSNYPWRQEPGFDPAGHETKLVEFFYQ